jgi:pantoate--beta-alanine ligase
VDIITSVAALRERLQREPDNVFVPTMGNLHAGHIELMRLAKQRGAACTVVSIFVNRLQFGPKEDFDRYPRTLQADADKMREVGVDVVFSPEEREIYPEHQTFVVEPSDLQHILEGAFRPGHFRGVATVVLKLFNMVSPRTAIFGKKDYQQYLVLRDMVRQLALPIEIIPAETVRAQDGLALSSRNAYLSPEERRIAPGLARVLQRIAAALSADPDAVVRETARGSADLEQAGFAVEYLEIREADTLAPVAATVTAPARVFAAIHLGRTRLIDNIPIG